MNNAAITEGKRVAAMVDDKLITGTIERTHSLLKIAIVRTDDDVMFKVPYGDIIVNEAEEKPEPEQEQTDSECVITISKEKFIETIAKLVAEDEKMPPMVGMSFLIFGAKLATKLFDSEE